MQYFSDITLKVKFSTSSNVIKYSADIKGITLEY